MPRRVRAISRVQPQRPCRARRGEAALDVGLQQSHHAQERRPADAGKTEQAGRIERVRGQRRRVPDSGTRGTRGSGARRAPRRRGSPDARGRESQPDGGDHRRPATTPATARPCPPRDADTPTTIARPSTAVHTVMPRESRPSFRGGGRRSPPAGRSKSATRSPPRTSGCRLRYRFHSRRGSDATRYTHSRPLRCIHAGARRFAPEMGDSNAAPTQKLSGAASRSRSCSPRRAASACPGRSHRTCAPLARIASAAASRSASVRSRKGGDWLPAIGYRGTPRRGGE